MMRDGTRRHYRWLDDCVTPKRRRQLEWNMNGAPGTLLNPIIKDAFGISNAKCNGSSPAGISSSSQSQWLCHVSSLPGFSSVWSCQEMETIVKTNASFELTKRENQRMRSASEEDFAVVVLRGRHKMICQLSESCVRTWAWMMRMSPTNSNNPTCRWMTWWFTWSEAFNGLPTGMMSHTQFYYAISIVWLVWVCICLWPAPFND